MSGRATPKRVAPLPARCARQMFFVADYDAVCAIMTTSLFLSPASSLSIYLAIIPPPPPHPHLPTPFLPSSSAPRTPAFSARWLWIFSFSLSLFPSRTAIFSLPTRTNFALASAARYDVVSDTPRGDQARSLSRYGFLAVYAYPHGIFGFSFSHLLLYISCFISFPLRSTASIG